MLHFIAFSLMINVSRQLEDLWYSNKKPAYLLIMLSKVFSWIVKIRAWFYKSGILKIRKVEVPVIVIGNITAGGTGKTPVTLFLSQWFSNKGKKVGIISRGYKGRENRQDPHIVSKEEKAIDFGDEAVYLARESNAMVCVCKNKVKAAELLVRSGVEVIISDDGLQHYKLARDWEIAVVDSSRLLGNQYFLPAGPLRESADRLNHMDLVLFNGQCETRDLVHGDTPTLNFSINNNNLVDLNDGSKQKLSEFKFDKVKVLAGIGNPEKLYKIIEQHGIAVTPINIEDHGQVNINHYSDDICPLLITPKDAVKYNESFPKNTYLLDPKIEIDEDYFSKIFGQYL